VVKFDYILDFLRQEQVKDAFCCPYLGVARQEFIVEIAALITRDI
jgi:hypothetical protein